MRLGLSRTALLSGLLLAGPVAAQTNTRMAQCEGSDPALVIPACTAVITSSQSSHDLVSLALSNRGIRESRTTLELIGCTPSELRLHLERQLLPGMTWQNHGQWHIDHIIPCAQFDLTDPEARRRCFHFSNLQPLWAAENIRKGGGSKSDRTKSS